MLRKKLLNSKVLFSNNNTTKTLINNIFNGFIIKIKLLLMYRSKLSERYSYIIIFIDKKYKLIISSHFYKDFIHLILFNSSDKISLHRLT